MEKKETEIGRREFVAKCSAGVVGIAAASTLGLAAPGAARTRRVVAMSDLHIGLVDDGQDGAYWLERAREFHCYADLPGVGGGRDEPFERYENIVLHDKGDIHWFDTREAEPRRIGLMLQSVTWHILNEKDSGNFNRNSMVIYTMEQLDDGTVKEHGYAFTEPKAERIGINLKWMLVNCSMTPRDQARPAL